MQSENEWIVQLGKGLVSKIKAYANNSPLQSFTLVKEHMYLQMENTILLLNLIAMSKQNLIPHLFLVLETNSSNLEVISRTSISSVTSSDFSNIICNNLSSGITIEASPAGTQTRAVSPSNYDTFCSVDKIQQPSGSWFCWACCIASMVNYMYGGIETYQSIAYLFNHYTDEGLTLAEIISKI